MQDADVFTIERPATRLLVYYALRSILVPFRLIAFPYHFFRYETMRYRFDPEGVTMSWGVIFRRQINLTYARIQDIHLTSTLLQRWLGLAELHIDTAAGSSTAAMTIEGVSNVEGLRDFLYAKMRDARAALGSSDAATHSVASLEMSRMLAALADVTSELRRTREALDRLGSSARTPS